MLTDVLSFLRCPVCEGSLAAGEQAVRCPRGHAFDVARQGYVNLAGGRVTHAGDSPAMVEARARWLASGAYDFLSAGLAAATNGAAGLVVDAGAGTGHHLAAVMEARPDTVGLALDVSKPALRRAARAHPRIGAVLADSWRGLPVADHSAAVVLNVFAPRNGAEFARVLRPGGTLVVVTPTVMHLTEVVEALEMLRVPEEKDERVTASLTPWFRLTDERVLSRTLSLSRARARTLVEMGPSAQHADSDRLAAVLDALPEPTPVTASVRLARYHPTRTTPIQGSFMWTGRSLPNRGAGHDRGPGR